MKLKLMLGSAVALAFCVGNVAYAKLTTYYPPERMHCSLTAAGKLSCSDFNRSYLTEDTYTADFPGGKEKLFYFESAAAYFAPGKEVTVFYSFHDIKGKIAKLRTTSTSIRPELENSNWKKLNEDIYTCDASYMSCGITNLPEGRF